MNVPKNLLYARTHEWVLKEGDVYTVGISDHAQTELGDLVFVNLPNVDDEVVAGEALADVESVKAVSDIISPVSGTVIEVNEELLDAPEKMNQAPYEAWIAKISNVSAMDELMDAEAYEAFLGEEG